MKNILQIKNHNHNLFMLNYDYDNKKIKKCILCNKLYDITDIYDNNDIRYYIHKNDMDLIIIYNIIIKNNLDIFDIFA